MNVNKFKQMIEKSKVEKKGRSIPNEFILLFLLALFFAVQVFFVGIITVELFKPGSLENIGLRRNSPQYTSVQSTTIPGAREVLVNVGGQNGKR
jgi:hypothetical protein